MAKSVAGSARGGRCVVGPDVPDGGRGGDIALTRVSLGVVTWLSSLVVAADVVAADVTFRDIFTGEVVVVERVGGDC